MKNRIVIGRCCASLVLLSTIIFGMGIGQCGLDGNSPISPPIDSGGGGHEVAPICSTHAECGDDSICRGGTCVKGNCVADYGPSECGADASPDVRARCCKPWQVCNELSVCAANPNSPISSQCEKDADCTKSGQFCSAGACYEAAGRTACSASFQCESDERCDLKVHLCVPNRGGCSFCAQFPELCCEEGLFCNPQTDRCIPKSAEQCTADNAKDVCRRNQKCHLGRCVQCATNSDCGPGTACDADSGVCYSVLNRCDADSDCPREKRCLSASHECVLPQCETDRECQSDDRRQRCGLSTYTCYLPAAICPSRPGEPNNTIATATALSINSFSGSLCRGDVDFLSFNASAGKRYKITLGLEYDTTGVEVALLNAAGEVVQTKTFTAGDRELSVVATNLDTLGTNYFIRLSGNGVARDLWSYSVAIKERDAPAAIDCSNSARGDGEPNGEFENAMLLDMAGESSKEFTFSRCELNDVDYFKVMIPPQHGIDASIEFVNEDGDLDLFLCKGPMCNRSWDRDVITRSSSGTNIERVSASEGLSQAWLKIAAPDYSALRDWDTNQSYTLRLQLTPRPSECMSDVGEPGNDGVLGALPLLEAQEISAIRCLGDVDYYQLQIPARSGAVLRTQFDHGKGDLRLDLLNSDSTTKSTSNSSSLSSGAEQIHVLPANTDRFFWVRVRLSGSSTSSAQPYQILASFYNGDMCFVSEPNANDQPEHGTPVPLPSGELSGYACGSEDVDWYSLGRITDDHIVSAHLTHEPGIGVLAMEIWAKTENGRMIKKALNANSHRAPSVKLEYALSSPGDNNLEYFVQVLPKDGSDPRVQPYQLNIETSWVCRADRHEGENGNGSLAAATPLRLVGASQPYDETLRATRCTEDLDFYRILYALPGEKIDVEVQGPSGLAIAIDAATGLQVSENDSVLVEGKLLLRRTLTVERGQEIFFHVTGENSLLQAQYQLRVKVRREETH